MSSQPTFASPVLVTNPVRIKPSGGGLAIATGTNPFAINFNNSLYLFFLEISGASYTIYSDNWGPVKSISPNQTSGGTSPVAVVFGGQLFVFFTHTSNTPFGLNYVYSSNGTTWTSQALMPPNEPNGLGIMSGTNPAVIALSQPSGIFIYYNGVGGGGIFCVYTYQPASSGKWFDVAPVKVAGSTQIMNILAGTSPAVVQFAGKVYLFFIVSGQNPGTTSNPTTSPASSGNNTIWMTTSAKGFNWAPPVAITPANVAPGSVINAVIIQGALFLFWNNGGITGMTGMVTLDGTTWLSGLNYDSQVSITSMTSSVMTAALLGNNPSVFWNGGIGSVYSASLAPVYSFSNTSLSSLISSAEAGQSFQVLVDNPTAVSLLQALIPANVLPQSFSSELLGGGYLVLVGGSGQALQPMNPTQVQDVSGMASKLLSFVYAVYFYAFRAFIVYQVVVVGNKFYLVLVRYMPPPA